jgi:hypothetical protein
MKARRSPNTAAGQSLSVKDGLDQRTTKNKTDRINTNKVDLGYFLKI